MRLFPWSRWWQRSPTRSPARARPRFRPRLEGLETRELLSNYTVVLATDTGGAGEWLHWTWEPPGCQCGPATFIASRRLPPCEPAQNGQKSS